MLNDGTLQKHRGIEKTDFKMEKGDTIILTLKFESFKYEIL